MPNTPKSRIELLGVVLGQPIHPPGVYGVTATKLEELVPAVRHHEKRSDELEQLRATLLVNFGNTVHNKTDFTIEDDDSSTLQMMVSVLQTLTKKIEYLKMQVQDQGMGSKGDK